MRLNQLILLAAGIFLAPLLQAESLQYEEGTHFVELEIPIKTRQPGKIEVAEYFSYGCPHCYQFDPLINAWKGQLGDDVVFVRTPAVWNRDYQVWAQTYYTAQALGVLEDIHVPLFNALHSQRRMINTPEKMAEFFTDFGVAKEDFVRAYNSFGVRASVQQADSRGRAYRATGVPTLIVNGKYRIEGSMAGSNANMLRIADFLIEKERKALNPS